MVASSARAPHPGAVPSSLASSHPRQQVLLGILFMCLAGLIFPFMTGTAKILGADYSSLQVSWARAFGHVLIMLAIFLPRRGMGLFRTRRPLLQLVRSTAMFTSNLCFFFAVTFIPLAKAAAVSLAAPLIVALLAWPLLRERTTPARVLASAFGFLGVLVVIRPGGALFHWASLFVLASAGCYALYQILTRKLAGVDQPETSNLYSSVIGALGMLLVVPFVWRTPATLADALMFVSLGVLGCAGHFLVVLAMGRAPANIVSPFQYFQLLGSVGIGWLFFADLPDAMTWLGAAIIVAAGLFIGWDQTRRR
jgi:drug/metabolite transporter (DMT)-like permease